MLKRVAFQYENEIRILLVGKEKSPGYRKGIKMPYKCLNTDLIQRIILDPKLEKMTFGMIESLLIDKYKFAAYEKPDGTIFNRVIQSAIYLDKSSKEIHF